MPSHIQVDFASSYILLIHLATSAVTAHLCNLMPPWSLLYRPSMFLGYKQIVRIFIILDWSDIMGSQDQFF